MDTSWSYTGGETVCFCSDESKWIRKIHKYKKLYPDAITIRHEPDRDEPYITADVPIRWMDGVKPPRKMNLTDAQRMAASERMNQLNLRKRAQNAKI